MSNIVVGVSFKRPGKVYYFDPDGIKLERGEFAVVKTTKGIEVGEIVESPKEKEPKEGAEPLKKVIRRVNDEDHAKLEADREKEGAALKHVAKRIVDFKLPMRLVEADQAFDGSKMTFYFTAENRVDFRDLVKDLATHFRTRIELRQVGVRDKARVVGGIGHCGQKLCCSVFLSDLNPVSIRMAKEQNLSLNPHKISGTCGRLMCCLQYEYAAYKDFHKRAPKKGSCVETCEGGKGCVIQENVLKERLKIRDDEGRVTEIALADVKSFTKPERKKQQQSRGQGGNRDRDGDKNQDNKKEGNRGRDRKRGQRQPR